MSVLTLSIIASLLFMLSFFIISKLRNKVDYLLDDYTEDDKPDNVRIIERDVVKYIEKEVIKEIPVEDLSKIDSLNNKLNILSTQKDELKDKIAQKELNVESISNELLTLETKFESEKEYLGDLLSEVTQEKDILFNENELLKTKLNKYIKENEELIKRLKVNDDEFNLLVYRMNEIEEKERNLMKLNEIKLNEDKANIDKLIEDRDYFIKLVETKDKEITNIKDNIKYEYKKYPNVYQGVDEYGKFYDISKIDNIFPTDHINKIINVSEQINPNQFAYYAINTSNEFENIEVHDINKLPSFIKRVKNKKTIGKYKIYIILDKRVYYYEVF